MAVQEIDLGKVVGANGKNAYQYAVEGGYTGTEAEFYTALVSLQNAPFIPQNSGDIQLLTGPYIGLSSNYDPNTVLMTVKDASASTISTLTLRPSPIGKTWIFGIADPISDYSAANKKYVDDLVGDIGNLLDTINGEVV